MQCMLTKTGGERSLDTFTLSLCIMCFSMQSKAKNYYKVQHLCMLIGCMLHSTILGHTVHGQELNLVACECNSTRICYIV